MASGDQIKQARDARGLSQQQVAEAIGVRKSTVQKIESGVTQRSRHLPEIKRLLGLPSDTEPVSFGYAAYMELAQIAAQQQALAERAQAILREIAARQRRKRGE